MTLKPDTFFMSEERWDDIEKDAEAREKAAQTPDQVWRSLALHAPMTMATAKRHGDVTKLVNFVCVLQRRIDAANEATKALEHSARTRTTLTASLMSSSRSSWK